MCLFQAVGGVIGKCLWEQYVEMRNAMMSAQILQNSNDLAHVPQVYLGGLKEAALI